MLQTPAVATYLGNKTVCYSHRIIFTVFQILQKFTKTKNRKRRENYDAPWNRHTCIFGVRHCFISTAVMPKALKNAGDPKEPLWCASLPPGSVPPGVFCLEAEKHSTEMAFKHKNSSHHKYHGLLISWAQLSLFLQIYSCSIIPIVV